MFEEIKVSDRILVPFSLAITDFDLYDKWELQCASRVPGARL